MSVQNTVPLVAFVVVPPLAGLPTLPPPTYTSFGAVSVIDTFIRSGPEPDSPALGSAKGFFVLDDNATGPGLELVSAAIFNDTSTISYRGYSQDRLPVQEVSISGGTGKFRLASGWADVSTASCAGLSSNFLFVSHVFYYDLE